MHGASAEIANEDAHPSPFAGWPVGLLITSKDDQVTLNGKSDRKEVDLLG